METRKIEPRVCFLLPLLPYGRIENVLCRSFGSLRAEPMDLEAISAVMSRSDLSGFILTVPSHFFDYDSPAALLALAQKHNIQLNVQLSPGSELVQFFTEAYDLAEQKIGIEIVFDRTLSTHDLQRLKKLEDCGGQLKFTFCPSRNFVAHEVLASLPEEILPRLGVHFSAKQAPGDEFLNPDEIFLLRRWLSRHMNSVPLVEYLGVEELAEPLPQVFSSHLSSQAAKRSHLSHELEIAGGYSSWAKVAIIHVWRWKLWSIFYLLMTSPYQMTMKAWRFLAANLWRLRQPMHLWRLHAWKFKVPLHQLHKNWWRILTPYYLLRKNVWRLFSPWHFLRMNGWRALMPWHAIKQNSWRVVLPWHFLKQNVWRVVLPWYFLKQNAWRVVLPWHFLKQNAWRVALPWHFLKQNAWRVVLPWYFLKQNAWRVVLPWHFLRQNTWRLLIPLYGAKIFAIRSAFFLLRTIQGLYWRTYPFTHSPIWWLQCHLPFLYWIGVFPFQKSYWFTRFQLSKLSHLGRWLGSSSRNKKCESQS